eukprot:4971229-Pleurochrysis_carterae.AAC.2
MQDVGGGTISGEQRACGKRAAAIATGPRLSQKFMPICKGDGKSGSARARRHKIHRIVHVVHAIPVSTHKGSSRSAGMERTANKRKPGTANKQISVNQIPESTQKGGKPGMWSEHSPVRAVASFVCTPASNAPPPPDPAPATHLTPTPP